MSNSAAILYHEPTIVTILIQTTFLLILNVVDFLLDKAVYCGLVGQIFIGMAYGTPGTNILGLDFQKTVTDLGYIGLILLVFEGGFSTDIRALRSNALLSTVVAITGISLPIGTSFVLIKLSNATVLQAFTAGCALSSTSLGTTFTVLKSSGLDKSRLGVVLTSAAMLDDVVGLVLVQIISNLGASGKGRFTALSVVRPVLVSIAFACLVPSLLYLWKITARKLPAVRSPKGFSLAKFESSQVQLGIQTSVLIAAVAGAGFAGTSTLFAAYLAGLLLTSCDNWEVEYNGHQEIVATAPASHATDTSETLAVAPTDNAESWEMVPPSSPERDTSHSTPIARSEIQQCPTSETNTEGKSHQVSPPKTDPPATINDEPTNYPQAVSSTREGHSASTNTVTVFEHYYTSALKRILKPFFFASIGFSIPITRLFHPQSLWRGLVYAVLMAFGKVCCGIWLVRFTRPIASSSAVPAIVAPSTTTTTISPPTPTPSPPPPSLTGSSILNILSSYRPQSLYPALILGSAMTARGEIGFLISAIAQSNGIFEQDDAARGNENGSESDQIFLIVTWAILLCTVVGPVAVGVMTRRVKALEMESRRDQGVGGKEHPLGMWRDI